MDPSAQSGVVLASVAERIANAFDLHVAEAETPADLYSMIHALLVERLSMLLSRQPERLMAILYRIDVDEEKVNHIFSSVFPTEVPFSLADLIIERQIQKAHTRKSG